MYIEYDYHFDGENVNQIVFSSTYEYIVNSVIVPAFGSKDFKERIRYFTLGNLLNELGLPDQVLMLTYKDDPDPMGFRQWMPASLLLIYGNNEIVIEYIYERRIDGQNYSICLGDYFQITVSVSDSDYTSIRKIGRSFGGGGGLNQYNFDDYVPLNVASGLDFTKVLTTLESSDSSNPCITCSQGYWH